MTGSASHRRVQPTAPLLPRPSHGVRANVLGATANGRRRKGESHAGMAASLVVTATKTFPRTADRATKADANAATAILSRQMTQNLATIPALSQSRLSSQIQPQPLKIDMSRGVFASVVAMALTLVSCGTGPGEFSRWHQLPDEGWPYGDTVRFLADTSATTATLGTLSVAVNHSNDYPYSNLWLEVTTSRTRDTVEIVLADVYGKWQGHGFGPSYQLEREIGLRIQDPGKPVSIRHIMRLDTLTGIEKIGVKFIK